MRMPSVKKSAASRDPVIELITRESWMHSASSSPAGAPSCAPMRYASWSRVGGGGGSRWGAGAAALVALQNLGDLMQIACRLLQVFVSALQVVLEIGAGRLEALAVGVEVLRRELRQLPLRGVHLRLGSGELRLVVVEEAVELCLLTGRRFGDGVRNLVLDGRQAAVGVTQPVEPELVVVARQYHGEDAELEVDVPHIAARGGDVALAVQLSLEVLQAGGVGGDIAGKRVGLVRGDVLAIQRVRHLAVQLGERFEAVLNALIAERDHALDVLGIAPGVGIGRGKRGERRGDGEREQGGAGKEREPGRQTVQDGEWMHIVRLS